MKKTITAIIAAALVCASFASCTNSTKNNNKPIVTDRQPLDSTISSQPEKAHFTFLEHNQDAPLVLKSEDTVYVSSAAEKVSFVAENRADRESAKKINEVLTQAHNRSKNIYDTLMNELDAYFAGENADLSVFPWETKVDYSCVRNDGKAISVVETIYTYSSGTISGITNFGYNFDPSTGSHISQIFCDITNKESFDNADNVMYEKLIAKYGEEVISYDNVSSSFVEAAQPFWHFTKDGVKVSFNPGSIADVSAGTLELEYTKEELPELAQKYFN